MIVALQVKYWFLKGTGLREFYFLIYLFDIVFCPSSFFLKNNNNANVNADADGINDSYCCYCCVVVMSDGIVSATRSEIKKSLNRNIFELFRLKIFNFSLLFVVYLFVCIVKFILLLLTIKE